MIQYEIKGNYLKPALIKFIKKLTKREKVKLFMM